MTWIGLLLFAAGLAWAVLLFIRQFATRLGAYEERYLASADAKLDALVVFMAPDDLLRISRGAGLLMFFTGCLLTFRVGIFAMLLAGALFGVLGIYLPRLVLEILLRLRRRRFLEQLPDAISMLNNAMKAGLGFMQAFDLVAREAPHPVGQEFAIFCKDRSTGKSLEDALDRLTERMPLPDVKIFAMVIKLSNRMGGNVTEALGRLAETIRNRFMIEKKVRSLTAEARMQAIVVCCIPFFLFVAFSLISPEFMAPLLDGVIGGIIIAVVLVLELLGGYFMWKAAQIDY